MSGNQISNQYEKSQGKSAKKDQEQGKQHKKTIKKMTEAHACKSGAISQFKSSSTLTAKLISASILQKYSITPTDYSLHIVDNLIDSANNHFIAVFKDHMIMDYIDEFLKRTYMIKESFERIPKFANYYKNYLLFFCKPMFTDLKINEVIQQYGEAAAKVYYNQNYGKQKKKAKPHISEKLKTIFSQTVKEGIDMNSSLGEPITVNNSISLTENDIFGKDINHKVSYYEESLISILDNFQQKKSIKTGTSSNKSKNTERGNNTKQLSQFPKKSPPKTERVDISKSKLKEKESSYDIRTSPCHTLTNQLNKNINKFCNSNNIRQTQAPNSRNKPIKLTTGQPLHMKTVSVQLQPQKENYLKNSCMTQNQGKLSSDSLLSNTKPVMQSKKASTSSQKQNGPNANPTNNLNLNDVMKLTLQLYYPSSKKNNRNTIQNKHLHQHTLSSPTINNFNININNHICLNDTKSPRVIRNYNSNHSNSNSNANLQTTTINTNRKKKQSITDELKKNMNLNLDLKKLMEKNKGLSRNKPQSLTKTKTDEIKVNKPSRNTISNNPNKLFTSFSIFDIQQQLLNSKGLFALNSKKSLASRKSNDYPSTNRQQQSLSQTRNFKNKNLQTVKSQTISNKINTQRGAKGNLIFLNKKI